MNYATQKFCTAGLLTIVSLFVISIPAAAQLFLGPEELVRANDIDIQVPGYSVPSFVFWDGDNLRDLVIGEGGGGVSEGKVRVYLNIGSSSIPQFSTYFYAQSDGADLVSLGGG